MMSDNPEPTQNDEPVSETKRIIAGRNLPPNTVTVIGPSVPLSPTSDDTAGASPVPIDSKPEPPPPPPPKKE